MMLLTVLVAFVTPATAFGQNVDEGAFVSRFDDAVDMTGWIWAVNLGNCSGQLAALEGTYKWDSLTVLTKSGQYLTRFNVQAHGRVLNTANGVTYQFKFSNHFGMLTDADDAAPTVYSRTVKEVLSGGGKEGENGFISITFHYTIDGNGVVRAEPERNKNVCPA